jgi:hypothetical protein
MCPACLVTMALLAAKATTTTGLAAIAVNKLRNKSDKEEKSLNQNDKEN